ncbi:MAG TPA: hypothetical protein VM509_10790 [Planctomycetota bacterium]|nr:hypothetical protein [Planctomycetota bacterium]
MKARARDAGPEPDIPLGPAAWSAYLSRELDGEVEVIFTRARRTVLRLQPRGEKRTVRMNEFFAAAPPPVRSAVVAWIRSGRRARRQLQILDAWVETQIEEVERAAPRSVRVITEGRVHDLARIAGELRESHFAGVFAHGGLPWPRLTWGRAPKTRTRRTLRLGSFDAWSNVVRMHPVLDQRGVPEAFVRYVLFHELLHAALPAERGDGGRRIFHSKEFRQRERAYEGTSAALAWEKANLAELLWSARTGKEMRPPNVVTRAVAALDRSPAAASGRGLRGLVQRFLFDA